MRRTVSDAGGSPYLPRDANVDTERPLTRPSQAVTSPSVNQHVLVLGHSRPPALGERTRQQTNGTTDCILRPETWCLPCTILAQVHTRSRSVSLVMMLDVCRAEEEEEEGVEGWDD